MARLFITSKELDLISDLTKEINKDVIGTKIYYYSISETKTKIHEIYDEAPDKIFENPIEVSAVVDYIESESKTTKFGVEKDYTVSVFLHNRDLLDIGLETNVGDFFSYGSTFFEITSKSIDKVLYGQIEHTAGTKLIAKPARKQQFVTKILGPTGEEHSDDNAIQDEFEQQRGQKSNSEGKTGDKRELQEKGILDKPITGAKKVKKSGSGSNFYDE